MEFIHLPFPLEVVVSRNDAPGSRRMRPCQTSYAFHPDGSFGKISRTESGACAFLDCLIDVRWSSTETRYALLRHFSVRCRTASPRTAVGSKRLDEKGRALIKSLALCDAFAHCSVKIYVRCLKTVRPLPILFPARRWITHVPDWYNGELRYAGAPYVKMPKQYSAPGEIRTPDPQVRSLMLYPTELRAHRKNKPFLFLPRPWPFAE